MERQPQPMQWPSWSRRPVSWAIRRSRSAFQPSESRRQSLAEGAWSGGPAQDTARVPSLVPGGPMACDQPLGFVEVEGGDADATAGRHFSVPAHSRTMFLEQVEKTNVFLRSQDGSVRGAPMW